MDDLNLDELEKDINNKNAVEERFRNLANSRNEAQAKAEAETKARQDAEAKLAALEKETQFLNSFSDSLTKFPGAAEYKDKIKEKFSSGYSLEDAAVAILHAEGKLNPQQPVVNRESPAGGSATNQITQPQNKSIQEMGRDDLLNALKEAEARGDISNR